MFRTPESSRPWATARYLFAVMALASALAGALPRLAHADQPRALLPLIVNTVDKGDCVVILRAGDVLVQVADLEQAGLRTVGGTREMIGDERFVSLSSLAPDVRFELDEQALALRLTVEPALLNGTSLDLAGTRPGNVSYAAAPSAYLNYAVSWNDLTRPAEPSGFAEAVVNLFGAALYSSGSRTDDGTLARGLTNLTIDDQPRMRRWVVGDTFASGGALGAGLLIGGVSLARNYGLDPYFVRYPTLGFAGTALAPSTVDVYVNGVLVRQERVPPGPFDIRNLPATAGSGVAEYVIRDAFGREQQVSSPYYASTGVLAKGLQEYDYNLGARRKTVADGLGTYGAPVFLATHRIALTDALTVGGHAEVASDLVNGGPSLNLLLPWGELEVLAAGSGAHGSAGVAGSAAYRYLARRFSIGTTVRALSSAYTTLSLDRHDDQARLEANLFAGFQVWPRVTMSMQYDAREYRDTGWQQRLGVSTSVRLTDHANLSLSVNPALPGSQGGRNGHETTAFASISYFFGGSTTGRVFRDQRGSSGRTGVQVQRPVPVGSGLGYRVGSAVADNGETTAAGFAQYQGPYGRYEVAYDHAAGHDTGRASIAGGLVAIGGGLHITRPVQDSFALIRVPGVKGVRGYLSNHEVGSTDGSGDLFVPGLLPYYGNRLRVSHTDLPMDYNIGDTEYVVAPPYRGGSVVDFAAHRVQSFTGKVVLDEAAGGAVVPAYGEVSVTTSSGEQTSPLGQDGELYFENLPPGAHTATVRYKGRLCDLVLQIPDNPAPFVDLGTTHCAMTAQEGHGTP